MVEGHRVADERLRIFAHEFLAVEDTRCGRDVARREAVVHQRLDVAQEGLAGAVVLSEVLQHVHAEDQAVLLLPLDTHTGREAGAEERLRLVEGVVGIFAVVETRGEVGADEDLLCPESSSADAESGGKRQKFSELHNFFSVEAPKIGKIFFI